MLTFVFLLSILTAAQCDSTALSLYDSAKYSEAIEMAESGIAEAAASGDEESRLNCLSTLSACYIRLAEYAKALEYAEEVYEYDLKDGNPDYIASDLDNISLIYHLSGRTEDALDYVLRSVEYTRKAGPSARAHLAVRLGNAADLHRNAGMLDEAVAFAREAYQIEVEDGREAKVPVRQCQLAGCLAASGKLDEAISLYMESIDGLRKTGNKESLCIACREIAAIIPDRAAARSYLEESVAIARETGNKKALMEGCRLLAVNLRHDSPDKAFANMEEAFALRDTLYDKASSEQIERFNVQFRVREKEHELEQQKTRMKYANAFMLMLFLFLSLAVVLLVAINRSRKSLEEKNMELSENLRFVSSQIDTFKEAATDVPSNLLTSRELDIIRLASQGKMSKEIADELCISVKTVDNIKRNIFKKLGVGTTLEMVIFAIRNHLV